MKKIFLAVHSPAGCLSRLFWLFSGDVCLFSPLIFIFYRHSFTIGDLAFRNVGGYFIISRYAAIRCLPFMTTVLPHSLSVIRHNPNTGAFSHA